MRRLAIVLCFNLFCGSLMSESAKPSITATVSPINLAQHQVQIRLTIPGDMLPQGGLLSLPTWTPGSYLVRDYARLIDEVKFDSGATVDKKDKQQWIIPAHSGPLTLTYRLYANVMSVRDTYIDEDQAHVMGASTFLYSESEMDRPYEIRFSGFPKEWKVATSLEQKGQAWHASSYDILVDSPIQLSNFYAHEWSDRGAQFLLAITGRHNGDQKKINEAFEKIVKEAGNIFSGFPFKRYVFLLGFSPKKGGGLEHLGSTSLLSDPFRFDKLDGYYGLYQLVAHEFFHAWNVKRIKDTVLGPFDYQKENYTELLWFHEGFTSYMEHQIVNRSGVIPWKQTQTELEKLWTSVAKAPGRKYQSLEQSSFDSWIKYYKPSEWTDVASISYYSHGELTGLMMDCSILKGSQGKFGLKDLFVELWKAKKDQGITDQDIRKAYEKLSGQSAQTFWDRYIAQSGEFDMGLVESTLGLSVKNTPSEKEKDFGINFQGATNIVNSVNPGTMAEKAGLSNGQEVLFVNRWRTTSSAEVLARLTDPVTSPLEVVVSFLGQEKRLNFDIQDIKIQNIKLGFIKDPSILQKTTFEAWSGQTFGNQ